MYRIVALALTIILLAGCVAQPAPLRSPLSIPFDSPLLPPLQRVYIPLVVKSALPKKGVSLACGYEDMTRMGREVAELGVSWVWNWGTQPPVFPGVESVPTIWDASHIGEALGGNSEWIIGPNECEHADQCNTSAEAMARAWPGLIAAYPGKKYCSPQVVDPGQHYLEEFYAFYQTQNNGAPPPMDALCVHTYYGKSLVAYQEQVRYYIALAEKWGVGEIWLTEFAIAPGLNRTLRESIDDTRAYIEWLEAQPLVTRYAPWTNRVECLTIIQPNGQFDTPMIAANGMLTEVGKMFRNILPTSDSQ